MLENFLTILRKLLNMPDLEIIRAGETVPDGLFKVPLRVNSYVLCLDTGVDWSTIFFIKSLCEFVLINLNHLQQVVEERHLLEKEFALVISSATEFLLHHDVITDRFSFLKKIAHYALFQDDQILFNMGIKEATLTTSRQKLDRTSEFLISVGEGELFGYRAGAFKCTVRCKHKFRKITIEAVKMRLLWLDRIHREELRADAEHKAKEALQLSNQCLSTIMNSTDAAIYIADMDTYELLFINKALKKIFGDVKIGQTCWQYLQNNMSGPCDFCTNHKLVSEDGEPTGIFAWEFQNTKTGQWVDCRDQAIHWIDGRLVRLEIATDITDRKQAEEEKKIIEEKLRRSQKMEAIGLMAGGVAHDLNNILSGIVSYPELLLLKLPADSPLRKPIKTIQESGNRAAAVVSDLLTVARGVASVQEIANLNDLINEYLISAEHIKIKAAKSSVVVKSKLATDLFNISCSSIHIKKVLMNLIINAFEAIELSGTIVISTANRYVDTPVKEGGIGNYVVLSISDNGSGISRDNLERIFDPFYTKKMMGRSGTGLGLTVVWNTMQDHDGYIDVKSNEKGTIFELYFPAVKDATSETKEEPEPAYLQGNGESILVVDDEQTQREVAYHMLTLLGYEVESVSGGEEAVEYVKKQPVDLLLLDMIMEPGINGRETYEKILNIHPGQKAIIASGWAESAEVKKAKDLGVAEYIRKPYTIAQIGQAIKEALKKDMIKSSPDRALI